MLMLSIKEPYPIFKMHGAICVRSNAEKHFQNVVKYLMGPWRKGLNSFPNLKKILIKLPFRLKKRPCKLLEKKLWVINLLIF